MRGVTSYRSRTSARRCAALANSGPGLPSVLTIRADSRLRTAAPDLGRYVPNKLSKLRFSPTTTIRCSIGVVVDGACAPAGAPSASSTAVSTAMRTGRRGSAVEPRQILRNEIAADHLCVGLDQFLGDWTRHRACAEFSAVQTAHAADAQARRGQEALVGGVSIVEVEIPLLAWDPKLPGEIDRRLAADPGQDIAFPGRLQFAVAHQKNVAALALGKIAIDVEQYCPGVGVLRLHLAVGEHEVQVLVH